MIYVLIFDLKISLLFSLKKYLVYKDDFKVSRYDYMFTRKKKREKKET